MDPRVNHLLLSLIMFRTITAAAVDRPTEPLLNVEDYCMLESFQPRCMHNEAILMNSAIYGRMSIGRCITAEEVAEFGSAFEGDPRYFGCSADVLSILDRKCSGKKQCDIRHLDISNELMSPPCFSSLKVYLEVSYECITVVDEDRSCTVTVSKAPSHMIASSDSHRKCATKDQPWVVEAPAGQKIRVTLIDFFASQISQNDDGAKRSCLGVIVDNASKRNVSICVGGEQRTRFLYLSKADSLEISYNTQKDIKDAKIFVLKLEAVGCSDLIAPDDAWLKRNDDSIVIGCYSNRLSWELHCDGERWIGVFGNCSQSLGREEIFLEEQKLKTSEWSDDQILMVFGVGGLLLVICLAVFCIGIVCLRKLSTKRRKSEEYKVLDFQFNSSVNTCKPGGTEPIHSSILPSAAIGNDSHSIRQQMAPTYSVFVGEGTFNDHPTNLH